MLIETTALPGVMVITPKKFGDARGFFAETYNADAWRDAGIDLTFVQDNHSHSRDAGVVRGLHYQLPPFAQAKAVRVLRGRILDVAVDLRRTSPTFGQHVAVELSAENFRQLLVPVGFAHGFCTLEADTEVAYKVTSPYAPQYDRGIAFDDPALGIAWPVNRATATLSAKDAALPTLAEARELFA